MHKVSSVVGGVLVVLSVVFVSVASSPAAPGPDSHTRLSLAESYGKLPLAFIKNEGQVDEKVRYYLRGKEGSIYFTRDGIVYDLAKKPTLLPQRFPGTQTPLPQELSGLSFVLKPVKASGKGKLTARDALPGKVNYLIGNDPSRWQKDIDLYREVVYEGIYDNIDLKVYGTNQQIEYDFVVHPGGNPGEIRMAFEGIKGLKVDDAGSLVIDTALSSLKHLKPVVYQEIKGKKVSIEGTYQVADTTFTFALGTYDPEYPLIIDPLTLSYSTYLGGATIDYASGIAVDASGNTYVTGWTTSAGFPSQAAYQGVHGGGYYDVFVTKINSSGDGLLYSTYLGGNGMDGSIALAIDAAGNVYVTGLTFSSNFPTLNAFQATYSGTVSYPDAFVAKLNSAGTTLLYSTYLGGTGDEQAIDLAIDSGGSAYVVGRTASTDFPVQNAYQGSYGGGNMDGFVAKFAPGGSTLAFASFLGGSDYDLAEGVVLDSAGSMYVVGNTYSSDFPVQNAYQGSLRGTCNLFVAKLNPSGNSLSYSTYLGGTSSDAASHGSIAIDPSGNVYVTGSTNSSDFPTLNPYQSSLKGSTDLFVAKLNVSGNALSYSTYLGGSGDEVGIGLAVDCLGNACVTGSTGSSNFPTQDPYQADYGGGLYDAFITKFNASGDTLMYSSYLGGNDQDWAEDIAVDTSGNVYVAGFAGSSNFPIQNAYQSVAGGLGDAFVAKLAYPISPLERRLYYPHIASNSTWETEIAVINESSTATVTGILRPYGDSGNEVSNPLAFSLSPHGRKQITIGAAFSNPEQVGYIILEADSGEVNGYTKFYQGGIYRVAIPAVNEINSGDLFITHIASNQTWWTGVSLLNTTAQPVQLNIEFDNGLVVPLPLAAKQHYKNTIETIVSGQAQTPINSAVIRNGSGVIGLELFGNTANETARRLEGILLTDDTATTLYYPQVANDAEWWTGIVAYNPAASATTLTVCPYSASGNSLTTTAVPLNAGQKYLGTTELLGLPAGTAWLRIDASSPVTGFELVGTRDGNRLGGYSNLASGSRQGLLAKLDKEGSTQIALVNVEDAAAAVTLTAYDDAGTLVATAQFTLASHQKVFDEAQDFFQQSISTATYLTYSADHNLVALQLNSSSDATMLDGLPGL